MDKHGSRKLQRGEPWADAVIAHMATLPKEPRAAWEGLLAHAFTVSSLKPSGRWLKEAQSRWERVGSDRFRPQILEWLELSAERRFHDLNRQNAELLKGLVWCCGFLDTPEMVRALGIAAQNCYRPGSHASLRSASVGNACVMVLAGMSGMESVRWLCQLQLRVKHRPSLQVIEKALRLAAERAGVTPEDLAELTVPTFGMRVPGVLEEAFGEHAVEVEISGATGAEWRWRNAEGKRQKSPPAAVKAEHAEELRQLRKRVTEVQKELPRQRDGLERLLRTERSWSLAQWRERYLEHPLLALLTRRLIWHFQDGDRKLLAIPHEGQLSDGEGRPVEDLSAATRVRLWHPIGFAPEEVLRWRVWLEAHGVTQPFKQAHREVYLLTDAELHTGTYSNRFAAHVLKQHQFLSLGTARGWQCRIDGFWGREPDSVAQLSLPGWGLRAEYRIEPVSDELFPENREERYVTTDHVLLFKDGAAEPLSLHEVPALVFTEVMRDVDLFVGVASVGNDPNWTDAVGHPRHHDYWTRYSFGDLSATAAIRKELLERLLPRLKIREHCRVDGKFLRVEGELRTYKIHLGSGNILMEPNDQYLCIVPERSGSGADGLFLPFEGDRMLSIILSKAFLLAEDRQIKDPTITRQIIHRL